MPLNVWQKLALFILPIPFNLQDRIEYRSVLNERVCGRFFTTGAALSNFTHNTWSLVCGSIASSLACSGGFECSRA